MSFIDEMFDESEVLSDEDREALAAEEAGVSYEPEPEPPPEMVEENRERERQLAEERERVWRLDERRRAAEIEAATRQQRPPEPPSRLGPRPDDYIDPIGADLYDVRREQELLHMKLEEQQRSADQREFSNWVNNDAAQFRSQHPDYDAATAHAYSFRVEYWKRLGLAEGQARAIVDQEAVATAMLARRNGKSAAAGFYELAQTVGYQPGGAQQPAARGVRQRQPAPMRGKPQTRAAVDIDAITEAQLETHLRRNPRDTRVAGALERRELLGR